MNKKIKISQKTLEKIQESFTNNAPDWGLVGQDLMYQIIWGSRIVDSGAVDVMERVKSKMNIPTWKQTVVAQADGCNLTPDVNNTHELANLQIDVCNFSHVDSLCTLDYEAFYGQEGMFRHTAGALSLDIQVDIINAYMEQASQGFIRMVEDSYLNGDTAAVPTPTNFHIYNCDGILKKMRTDANVNHVHGLGVPGPVLTAANVIAEMQLVYDAIPNSTLFNYPVYIAVSAKAYRLLQTAFTNATGFFSQPSVAGLQLQNPFDVNSPMSFQGLQVIMLPMMPDNTIFATYKKNLKLATDLVSDFTNFNIIPEYMYKAGNRTIGIDSRWKLGNAYVFANDVVHRF